MRNYIIYGGLVLLAGITMLLWQEVLAARAFTVTLFDVGQGDSIYITTTTGSRILIDGGPDATVLEKLGSSIPFWSKRIDLLVLTHTDADHLSGLVDVLERYEVEHILWTGIEASTSTFKAWEKALETEGAKITIAAAPQIINWGGKAYARVIHPIQGFETTVVNDTSVVVQLVHPDTSLLLVGDATTRVEGNIGVKSDILKIGHHGSKTSTSASFIEAVQPQLAIIQVGKDNSYGHPHSSVLETLSEYGIDIKRTDLDGDIVLRF